jgi:hypothetical protein
VRGIADLFRHYSPGWLSSRSSPRPP